MIDISVHELHKFYGANHVIQGISFEINSGERVGLLGKNGSGKSTLFKTITGEETYESGTIAKANSRRIEMLAQMPVFADDATVDGILRSSFQEITDTFNEMKRLESDLSPASLARYGRLMDAYEQMGGYDIEVKLDKVCGGMHIDERLRNSLFSQLSGGEKTRVNLARILLRTCDILLLDEPTNHLDLASLAWLEQFLQAFTGTVIVISHDRVFLDRVVTRIIAMEEGKANFYAGNYSFYVEERQQRFLTQAEQYKQQQRKISQLEEAIRRQRVWADINKGNSSLAKRALAMEKRIEQMDKVERPKTDRKLTAEFESGGYAAKEVVSLGAVCKSYGAKPLLRDVSLKIRRNDRIALVGDNGCGKSTLLKMLMQEEQPDSGEIKMSISAKPAYMPQIITFENPDATILATMQLAFGLISEKARNILAGFHFRADEVMKQVKNLSGGEKSRLKLCMLMQNSTNLLLLDEPTNHLDIASREWIESALHDFEGTMLFVSHDRYFLNQFATQIWHMENGSITPYEDGFDAYIEATHKPTKEAKPASKRKPQKVQRPIEERIIEAEAALAKASADAKPRLEAQIESLYKEWMKEGM
ncbi:MAG: ATP-binding cassette domain-containing protein [Oscillospiraceae bacterium]|jgi:ATPase subunit of ABC transporter with duplicated ATPase domains|nr:ATP-binding cassette domain-containing protein [Oscillospiraceae bacterium]